MPRRFNRTQRHVLMAMAAGRCRQCGVLLTRANTHADHMKPYARGGTTEVTNGQLLCARCNQRKGVKNVSNTSTNTNTNHNTHQRAGRSPRQWQTQCLAEARRVQARGENTFVISAAPGAGKTDATLMIYAALKHTVGDPAKTPLLVVLAPTQSVRSVWPKDGKAFGLVIKETWDEHTINDVRKGATDGIAQTYAGASGDYGKAMLAALAQEFNIVLVCDEVHWLQDHPEAKWPEATRAMTSAFNIALSGTPYRSGEDEQICLFTYDEDGTTLSARPHFSYTYEDALRDGISPVVLTSHQGGRVEWSDLSFDQYGNVVIDPVLGGVLMKDGSHIFGDPVVEAFTDKGGRKLYTNEEDMNRGLARALFAESAKTVAARNAAVKPGAPKTAASMSPFLATLLDRADDHLQALRSGKHKDAAGLALALSCEHADAIVEYLRRRGRKVVPVYTNSGSDNVKAIEAFAKSTDAWMVAVKMVSEGVTIRRLRVLAYTTNVTTKRHFVQSVGRLMRLVDDTTILYTEQPVMVFLPQDARLVDWSQDFQKAVTHVVQSNKAVAASVAAALASIGQPQGRTYRTPLTILGDAEHAGGTINGTLMTAAEADALIAAHSDAFLKLGLVPLEAWRGMDAVGKVNELKWYLAIYNTALKAAREYNAAMGVA